MIDFRFVLYQLSKNLNRPFFIDFLTDLSVKPQEEDPEDRDDCGKIFIQKEIESVSIRLHVV